VFTTDDKEAPMHIRLFTSSILSVAVLAIVAHAAIAAGEPKSVRPFTRPVPARVTQAASRVTASHVEPAAEQKNEAPFTRLVLVRRPQPTVSGEPKNGLPFTAAAVPATVAVASPDSGAGFSWADAALGAALGVSLSAGAAGAVLLARRKVPRPA
jgi:hypothetical protein